MVNITTVRESNTRFARQPLEGLVCVFAGATSGIGLATLQNLITLVRSSTFYVLGRKPERYAGLLDEMRALAPTNKIIFIETLISLISGIDAASAQITSAEQKIDLMCMSPGGMPFGGADYTKEGLETCFAVSYYSRLRLVSNLLPLLNRAPHPRALSILNGTYEKKINEDDIGLEKKWGITQVVAHTTLLTSLAFDHLSANDGKKHLTFIHGTPGFVNTGVPRSVRPTFKDGYLWWAFISFMQIVSGWIIRKFGMAGKESGERYAFLLTTDTIGTGSWRTTRHSDIYPDNKALKEYEEGGWREKIWDFTLGVWEKALATGATS